MREYRSEWIGAQPWSDYLAGVGRHRDLWHGIAQRARVDDVLVRTVERLTRRWHLLAISEDWCGDASNILPVVARLAERAKNLDLRVVGRESHPTLMDEHLTSDTRSIPVVMILDDRFRERAWWRPRPAELQTLFVSELRGAPKEIRYPPMCGWYARDGGASIAREIVELMVGAAGDVVHGSAGAA
jgi:hypothetical protein